MADTASDANMARSAALQDEWNALRDEMDALVSAMSRASTPAQRDRKAAITARMTAITAEMGLVLQSARAKLPPESARHPDADPPVYSPRNKHRVERTYDSSDSDGPPPSRPAVDLAAAPALPRVTVESPAARVRGEFNALAALGTKLRGTLRRPESPRSAPVAVAPVPAAPAPAAAAAAAALSDDDREALKLEESRLERELRRLRREDHGPDEDTAARAAQVAARLKEITDLNLDGAPPPTPPPPDDPAPPSRAAKAAKALFDAARSPRRWAADGRSPKGGASAASSPAASSAGAPDSSAEVEAIAQPGSKDSDDVAAKKAAKRKGWAGMRSALGMKMPGAQKGPKADKKTDPLSPAGVADGASTPPSATAPTAAANGNEFAETRDRLLQRGDQLQGLANDTQDMRDGAGDLLAATRALRKRKTKKGLFS